MTTHEKCARSDKAAPVKGVRESFLSVPRTLTRLFLIAAAAAVLASAGWSAPVRPAKAASELVCNASVFDFGRLAPAQATKLTHEFSLTNMSKHPIRVIRNSRTCGCMSSNVTDQPIPPGGVVAVSVTVDWSRGLGPKKDRVYLVTDENDADPLALDVIGIVQSPVAVAPEMLKFGMIAPGEKKTLAVRLVAVGDASLLRPGKVESMSKKVSVALLEPVSEAGSPGRFVEYAVTVTGQREPGFTLSQVVFHLEDAKLPSLSVVVAASFPGVIRVDSPALCLRAFGSGEVVSNVLRVDCPASEQPPAIRIVEMSEGEPSFIVTQVKAEERDGRRINEVKVDFNPTRLTDATRRCFLRIVVGGDKLDVPILGVSG